MRDVHLGGKTGVAKCEASWRHVCVPHLDGLFRVSDGRLVRSFPPLAGCMICIWFLQKTLFFTWHPNCGHLNLSVTVKKISFMSQRMEFSTCFFSFQAAIFHCWNCGFWRYTIKGIFVLW